MTSKQMTFVCNLNPRTHRIDDHASEEIFDALYQCPSCKLICVVTDEEKYKMPIEFGYVLCNHNGKFDLVGKDELVGRDGE